ncbi:rifamycin-inactivating phosphotransferase [Dactylosporangium sp. CA-052675]|uniref:rifamycin-inactivating phosphotransferase n=1 Tax=Dactylosporangium sp. CA-052675 TaxID=3239927 RepID=UPI003D8F9369
MRVLAFHEVDETRAAAVGGKGANLAALSRLEGVRVPDGFCVTTDAFGQVVAGAIDDLLDRLALVDPDDREAVRALSAEIRRTVEEVAIPDDLAAEITGALARLGEREAYAVRSSATAEDLPTASFAGQQDSYLDVVGPAEILRHVSRCWASLFTERAVTYRRRNGIDDRAVRMAVVVQRMVDPRASGVMFTADPVTSNRTVTSVEAIAGLGEALVAGLANPDTFTVRDGEILAKPADPLLTDAQVHRLVHLGRRIEAYFGRPQDIEWCLAGDDFFVVQSRPITTLFPIPERGDDEHHVYLSVGHQQMMTDAMKPLGISFWQMTTPAPMAVAGGRLFVDVTQRLAVPAARAAVLDLMAKSDPLTADAVRTLLERDGFIRPLPDAGPVRPLAGGALEPIETDPAVVTELIRRGEASVAAAEREIRTKSGEALLDFIRADLQELRRILFDPESRRVYLPAMEATWWLNERLEEWLGERNAADTLAQSVPNNVTSEMGLALLDVADAIRPHPDVVERLRHVQDDGFLDELPEPARQAIEGWLHRYGMRCVGEIDITRPRWSERPSTLVPLILGNIRNFEPGAGARRFEQGRQEAWRKEQEILARLRELPDGEHKAAETKQRIDRVRTFIGYREYPKYGMISRYFVYKRALLEEAERLVRAGVLREREDIYYLSFDELGEVVRTQRADHALIAARREQFRWYETLTPPRVLTSDGEGINGSYRRDDLPPGSLAGLPVSAGTVEGRARVILDLAQADPEPGDILVTAHTDPSWTPLFVSVAGLVTEVGGLMTHGAVIAREYGLPAVVGVVDATRLIADGQRIRVHGTEGYIELLP